MLVGRIIGRTSPEWFQFEVTNTIKKMDFIAVRDPERHWVLGRIEGIIQEKDQTIARVSVIGYTDKRGRVRAPKMPFKPGSYVYKADDGLIKKVLGLKSSGLYVGLLDGSEGLKVFLDPRLLVTKHLAVLSKTGFGKSYFISIILEEFMENKNIFTLIKEKILSKGSPLLEEIPFILRQEFRDPKTYMSILSAISLGNRNLGKIVNYCGFQSKTGIMPYLYNLENLGYIKRELPVTEKPRSKRGLYFISDNYFDFWFKFIRRNMSLIEIDIRKALGEIKKKFNEHVAFIFEDICKEYLVHSKFFDFTKIGRWWYKDKEIDLIGFNEVDKRILFVECKWHNNINAEKIAEELLDKSKYVQWYNDEREEYLVIFAKTFKEKISEYQDRKVYCFDLKDIERYLTT